MKVENFIAKLAFLVVVCFRVSFQADPLFTHCANFPAWIFNQKKCFVHGPPADSGLSIAEAHCASVGGHLAILDNSKLIDAVSPLFFAAGAWRIGLYQQATGAENDQGWEWRAPGYPSWPLGTISLWDILQPSDAETNNPTPPYDYGIIQTASKRLHDAGPNGWPAFCEITRTPEGKRPNQIFLLRDRDKRYNDYEIQAIQTNTGYGKMECTIMCSKHPACTAFSVNEFTGNCTMHSARFAGTEPSVVPERMICDICDICCFVFDCLVV